MVAKKKDKEIPMKRGKKFKNMWDNMHRVGRPPAFENPKQLFELAMEYFQWLEDNPLQESKICSFQGVNELEEIPKKRPFTIGGLCLYMGITQQTLLTYKGFPDYTEVYNMILEAIRDQKFQGAAAGFFNHAIIARDLGLKDGETNIVINNNLNPEQEMIDRGVPLPDMGDVDDLDEEG